MTTEPTPSPTPSGFDAWTPYLKQIGFALLAVGVGVAILFLVIGYRGEWTNVPLLAWGIGVAVLCVATGILCLTPDIAPEYAPSDFLRLVVLLLLSTVGFLTALLGLLLPFMHYSEQLGTELKTWREHSGILSLCIGAFVGGLVLMFVGLSLGRGYERTRPALRRLLYGYNAVFSSLLLLLILAILNILAYSPVWPFSKLNGQPIDWTSGHLYSLKPESKKLLVQIDKPVKVYIIMPTRFDLTTDMINLVKNCQEVNPQITWETVSPQTSDEKIKSLRADYNLPAENPLGALVVYGGEPSKQFRFLAISDLSKPYTDEFGQQMTNEDGSPRRYFTGEIALIKALRQVAFEDKPVKVYFTQGNGEMDFGRVNEKNPRQSMALLKQQFDEKLYDLAALPFDKDGAAKGVPADANIVVVAGPTERLAPEAVQALRDYLSNKKGKLFLMLGAQRNPEGEGLKPTGLEPLASEYGVSLGEGLVLYARFAEAFERMGTVDDPASLRVQANPDSNNPIARAFSDEQREFRFDFARTVTKAMSPGNPSQSVEELIVTMPSRGAFVDKTLNTSRVQLAKTLLQNPDVYARMVSKTPLPLAATVSEGGKPQLIVVGDSLWISDLIMHGTVLGNNNFELFNSCLSWLVDRPDLGVVINDKPPSYTLNIPEGQFKVWMWLPGLLMTIGVLTLGAGVWVVRRR